MPFVFDLAEPIIAAVTSALGIGDCGYPHFGQLPDAFAQFAAQRLGWTVEPSRVFAIPDVMTGLAEVVQAITPPGSGIVINPPVYPPFRFQFGFYGRRIIDAPLARGADGRYALDPDAIEAALSEPDAAVYLLCSPHNPTGNVWSPADLAMVADACQRHGAVLLVDEIHAPLVLDGARFTPFLAIDHELTQADTTFTCPGQAMPRRRPVSWPGWTAVTWAWATIRQRCSWTRAVWRWAAGRTLVKAAGSRG